MKKILLLALCITSMFTLVACGKKSVSNTTTGDNNVNTANQADGQENKANNQGEDVNASMVQNGDTVSVMYVGSLPDGEVFDTNIIDKAKDAGIYNELRPYEELAFTIGQRQMIPGFESGVIGMSINETKTINIPALQGYGPVRDEMIQSIPTSVFDEVGTDWKSWEVGKSYNFNGIDGTVLEKSDTAIKIDFNHFLAGKDLVFTVTVKGIEKGNFVELPQVVEDTLPEAQ